MMSCGNRDKVPDDVFGPEKMGKVLTDLLLAESFAEGYLLIDTTHTRDEAFTGELNKVLAIQKISPEEFRRSMNFYKSRPDLYKVIVDTAYNRAQRNRDHIYDEQKKLPLKVE
jgi:Domain of unknown function (DUF4296)